MFFTWINFHTFLKYSIFSSLRALKSTPKENLLRLLLSGGSPKEVKVNLEPFVDTGMNSMVLVTDLLRCQAFLSGLVLGSRAVLIRATDKQHIPPSQLAVSGKNEATFSGATENVKLGKKKKGYLNSYLEKTSALRTQPMMLPRWGTLLTYGKALVMRTFRLPSCGILCRNI